VEGPQGTPYEGKFFRLKLVLGMEFPTSPPRGFFLTKIYHPNVDMTSGAICVNTLKKDWAPDTTFSHVLSVIRCLLIYPFPESSLNDEAGKLFMESYEEYSKRALLMADVHGRPHSSAVEGDEKRRKTESEDGEECDSPQRRKTRVGENGSNPLASKNSNSISSDSGGTNGNKPGKSLGAKNPSSNRLTKKKSLKRL
jgi:ubiquitin-conjugating enzyme E2 S